MDDCVFCNIVNKTIDSELLFENENLIVIRDILPKAPVHLLILPKRHVMSVNHIEELDKAVIGEMVYVAKQMAEKFGVSETGYKLIFNVGRDGGQVIPHLHLHLLGGKSLGE
ncbi:MAG: histidine triad nucleotide-binding protein [Candidatus Doudnabacteria bacterium CG10_big_fil_rev_8_21_14_0_10_42_18]|uniref:Histidine triad nucleotide-binding protein n=1 Tax=Candidatus Doudnabacteria bacterium CG10_big_fil_rev_8_21_14_0_10_42_18 TaxID=1974552 RepID=A0A2H0VA45_9BACT|nr:MAG: histidine triad nucleotide-binding protein [Candidatus Doudnabacteria bacterium CG10_big_fil_rev_8_21_14_0_10_42_18]